MAIFGDGATYHNSQEFREYLMLINQEKPEYKWWINCIKFAPNVPEQNPVEDIWLQTKNFMIAFYHLCSSFNPHSELPACSTKRYMNYHYYFEPTN